MSTIIAWINDFVTMLLCVFKNALCWFEGWLIDLVGGFISLLFDSLPEIPAVPLVEFMYFVKFVNAWVPLDFIISMTTSYYLFRASYATFRLILKTVPFIG